MSSSAQRNIISTMSDDQLKTLVQDEAEGGTALVNDLVRENLALERRSRTSGCIARSPTRIR